MTVYAAGNGSCYHSKWPVTCGGIASRLDASEIEEISKAEAADRGLSACGTCC